ncbi:MAG TPA: ABC transporter permease [Opitutaceae bacterium]|nr:ABC transporter permease [Opitutaceae bacterium]
MHDLKFALRQLRKSPAFFAVAVLTLAVGIGATTAMFSSLRALVVEPFSYPHADRLVHVWSNDGQPLSTPDYFDIHEQATSFAELGAYSPRPANLGGENAQSVRSVSCTPGVLRAFGVTPALGRLFAPADEEKGAPLVAVLSHRLWQQAFAGDPGLVGRTIRLNDGNVTVVGIMPASFEFASPWMSTASCEVWLPLQLQRGEGDRGSHWLCTVGRLKDGVTLAAADTEIKAIGARLKAAYPDTNTKKPFLVRSLYFEMTRYVRSQVWLLFGAVALVLLIACANVASMLLARSARRHGEFGVRLALGATRLQILRLALSESVLLALAGAVLGLGLAAGGIRLLQFIAPVSEARKAAMTLDGGVLLFAAGLGLLTALLAGLPPAFAATRIAVADLLRVDSRGAAGSRTRHHLLRGLIVAQVAVAFVLANGAALFSAGYVKLLAANSSLATDYVLSAELNLRGDRYAKKEVRAQFFDLLAARAATLPGVTVAGITTKLPLEGGSNLNILVNDEVFDPAAKRPLVEVSAVTPGYFAAAGLTLLRGRTLEPGDAGEDAIGVVVNRALVDQCWPGQDPLGKVFRPNSAKTWFHARVVGVVESVRQWGADSEPRPELYWAPDHAWGQTLFLLLRSPQPASQLAPGLRRAVAELDPDLPVARIRTLQTVVDEATKGQRVVAGLVDFFMAVALGLVAVGLYGTLSYHILQRTREIGVRMALGAARRDIVRLVFRQGSGWTLIGVTIGIGGALALASTLRSLVYGLDSIDPVSLVAATAAVALAATLACWLPARRAARVDPIIALRTE